MEMPVQEFLEIRAFRSTEFRQQGSADRSQLRPAGHRGIGNPFTAPAKVSAEPRIGGPIGTVCMK